MALRELAPAMIAGLPEDEFLALCDSFIALRGRLIVLLDEHTEKLGEIVLLPYDQRESEHQKHRLTNRRLLGATVISSGLRDYHAGDRVAVFPWCYEGVVHMRHGDPSCSCSHLIPEGREIRFYKPDYTTDWKDRKVLMPGEDQHGRIMPQGAVKNKVPLLIYA